MTLKTYSVEAQGSRVCTLLSILGLNSEHERRLLEGPEKFGFPV